MRLNAEPDGPSNFCNSPLAANQVSSGLDRFDDIEPVVRTPSKNEHVGNRVVSRGSRDPLVRG